MAHPLFQVAYPSIPSTRRHSKKFLTPFGGHLVCVKGLQNFKVYVEGMLLSGICPPWMVGQMPTADSFCNTLALFSLNFPCDTLLIAVRHHVTKIEFFFLPMLYIGWQPWSGALLKQVPSTYFRNALLRGCYPTGEYPSQESGGILHL